MARLQYSENRSLSRQALSQRKYAKTATQQELFLLSETGLDGTDCLANAENRAHFNLGAGCIWKRSKPTESL